VDPKNRSSLRLEQLESREVPSVTRNIGHFFLESQANFRGRFHRWESEDLTDNYGDFLKGSLAATYSFTKDELALARSNAGLTLTEEIRWRESDTPNLDDDIKITKAAYKWNIAQNANGGSLTYAPGDWLRSVDDDDGGVEGYQVEYYGWLNHPSGPGNYSTGEIRVIHGALADSSGGTWVDNQVAGTAGIGYADGSAFANPALPNLMPGGYRVLAFASQNGTDFTVSAANATGYNLLAASSNALAWDATAQDTVIPQTTSFSTVYATGSTTAGLWAGGDTAWVIRNAAGDKTFYLTGCAYTQMPASLLGLPDNQSTTVSGGSLQTGNDVLWLTFETDGETVSFLLTGHPTNAAPDAVNDGVTTPTNTSVAVPVLANDTDANGDPLTITGVTQGAHGTVTYTSTGVTYTPNAGWTGTDTFTYTISDGYGGTDTAMVTVTAGAPVPIPIGTPVTITGSLWLDFNQDGLQTAEPLDTTPVQVYLFDGSGNQLAVTTAVNGTYSFTNLPPGQYQVRVAVPPGRTVSPQDLGPNDTIDNDFNSLGQSAVFTLAAGASLDLDIGWW
jgi:hypothetical protein